MASRNNQEEISRNISTSEIECELNQDKYLRKIKKRSKTPHSASRLRQLMQVFSFAMPSLCTRESRAHYMLLLLCYWHILWVSAMLINISEILFGEGGKGVNICSEYSRLSYNKQSPHYDLSY